MVIEIATTKTMWEDQLHDVLRVIVPAFDSLKLHAFICAANRISMYDVDKLRDVCSDYDISLR